MSRRNGFAIIIGLLIFRYVASEIDRTRPSSYAIEPCPPSKVCVNFVHDSCTITDGEWDKVVVGKEIAVVWDHQDLQRRCQYETTNTIYAALEIQLHDLYTWSIVVTSYRLPVEIGFSFSNATIKFHNDTTVEFQWFAKGKHEIDLIPAQTLPELETSLFYYNLQRRSFNITANGEKLITLLGGPGFVYTSKSDTASMYLNPSEIELSDERYLENLEERTYCNFSEIIEKCYDNCDKLKDVIKTAYCSSQLWYHNPSKPTTIIQLRDWKKAEAIECRMGSWWAEGLGGSNTSSILIDGSLEVQCSKDEPAKMTATSKQILGFGIGGPLLILMIGLIIFIFIAHHRRRMREDKDKASTKRSSESTRKEKKSEYFFKKSDKHSKSTEREGKNIDRHTKSSNRAVGVSPESPGTPSPKGNAAAAASRPTAARHPKLLQEPKGAENAAGPPLPDGFVSVSLA